MRRRARASLLPWLAALLAAASCPAAAPGAGAAVWKIATSRDKLTDQVTRFAVTMPKSAPVQLGRSVTTLLIIKCGSAFTVGPTHPQLMIMFPSLAGLWRRKMVETRFRFDDGPVRDYKLKVGTSGAARAVMLPKFADQDPVADLIAARRLRVEMKLPFAGSALLDFDVTGAGAAVQAIACK